MSKFQTLDNPTSNFNLTTTTYVFATTGASGTVNASGGVDVSALKTGDSIFLSISGGTSNGFTDVGEYFVIPGTSGSFQVAASKADAFAGTYVSGASGNAGNGTIYPNYVVAGVLTANTAGNLYVRGINNKDTGWSSFSLQTTVANGSILPYMIGHVSASGLTAGSLVSWSN